MISPRCNRDKATDGNLIFAETHHLKKRGIIFLLFLLTALAGCETLNVYEKNVSVPGHAWPSAFRPQVSFNITDTTSFYQIWFVIRHTDAYGYNNIWVDVSSRSPGDTAAQTQRFDLPLADQQRWTGSGMDDIYEHRILLYREPVKFRQPGTYQVGFTQLMREDPLKHVMNVGLRIEKVRR